MSGGLEIVIPVASPLLERVAKEERVGRDHPRRPRDERSAHGTKDNDADAKDEAGDSKMSSTHIDLRI
jgi:hypothetical protein